MISRNDPCWCGSGKKWKKCHFPEKPKQESSLFDSYLSTYGILLKTEEQIQKIREACQFSKSVLNTLIEHAKPGVTTNQLNDISEKLHKEKGAIPAAFHYGSPPFPKGICTSLNDVICHGIPNDIPLKEGDIMNIDVASIVDGYFGDLSKMVVIGGKTDPERQKVVDVAYECLMRSIAILKPGTLLSSIGKVIEDYAKQHGCSVVNQFVGHGVGLRFHEPPQVSHHYNHDDILLAPGMTFTIEPMINAGLREAVIDPVNHWEARTVDGCASAQWEHTLLITSSGHEILTE